jgi:hypothetical protein
MVLELTYGKIPGCHGELLADQSHRGDLSFFLKSDLIDPYTGTWDKELIKDIYWEDDVQHILSIPVEHGKEDFPAWHFDTKGIFSVKFAYHVLEDNRENDQTKQHGATSSMMATDMSLQWPGLWNSKYQPKGKQFLWRLAHNSLPFKLNIKRKGVKDVDTRCSVCNRLDEDGGHCFLKCKIVKKCWQTLNIESVRVKLLEMTSPRDIVHFVLNLKGKEGATVTYLLQRMNTRNDPVQQQGQRKWKPPPPDVIKINIDCAFCVKERKGAWGFVICDSAGQGALAGFGNLPAVHDSLTTEAEACVEALNTSMAVGISQIIVEKDLTNLVVALQSSSFDLAPGGVIFREARRLLELDFALRCIVFVPCTCNRCAHELARLGLARDPDAPIIWNDPLPSFVNSLVDRDFTDPSFGE